MQWTQWQALQARNLRDVRKRMSVIVNKTFEEVVPNALEQIENAYHDASEAWTEETVRNFKEAGIEVPRDKLPVARGSTPVRERLSIEFDPYEEAEEIEKTEEPAKRLENAIQTDSPAYPTQEIGKDKERVKSKSDEDLTHSTVDKGVEVAEIEKKEETVEEPLEKTPTTKTKISKSTKAKLEANVEMLTGSDDNFFGVYEDKLEVILKDVQTDMDKARYSAIERSGGIYAEIMKRADVYFGSGTYTLWQAVDMATKEASRHGLNAVVYSDGRLVNVASYVEMALRTSQHRAVLQAEAVMRDKAGHYLVTSPLVLSTCPSCYYWQGEILVDDVYSSGTPDKKHRLVSEAMRYYPDEVTGVHKGSHFLGPNCRHILVTYWEGLTEIPTKSPLDVTKRYYDSEQRQRAIERKIRRYKREELLAVEEQSKAKAQEMVKKWQSEMRDHLKKHTQLRRNPAREKLFA